MQLKAGDRIGDYEVLGVLGAGGMGSVYKVRNVISDRVEAIKLLLPNLVEHQELKDRFLREIKTSASLEHPAIASLRTAFQSGDMLLMVMEYVEGETLDSRLRNGPLAIPEAARITAQVLEALEYAHSRGVVHRDIKPANVMISTKGGVKLLDFGIAKATTDKQITVAGTTMGSLYYMSPEQIRGEQVDQRADLYSLGITLYELTTGKRPFGGESGYAIMAEHLQKQPIPPVEIDPRVPASMSTVILRALAKNPTDRYQSAAEFRRDLLGSITPADATVVATKPSLGNDAFADFTAPKAAAPIPMPPAPPAQPAGPTATAFTPPAAPFVPTPANQQQSAQAGFGNAYPPAANDANATTGRKPSNTLALVMVALIVVLVLGAVVAVFAGSWLMGSSETTTANAKPGILESIFGSKSKTNDTTPATAPAVAESTPSSSAPSDESPIESAGNTGTTGSGAMASASTAPSASVPPATPGSIEPVAPSKGNAPRAKNETQVAGNYAKSAAGSLGSQVGAASPRAAQQSGSDAYQSPVAPPVVNNVPQTPAVDTQALERAQDFFSKLGVRAGTVQESARKLIEEQSSMGMTLRADMRASMKRMEMLMDQAESSLNNKDLPKAQQQMQGAEREIEKLEKFFRI